ncbi:Zinc finger CCCH domain-containing protein [Trichinella pseudospiralis]
MNFSEGEESSSNKLYQGDNHNAVKEATIFVGNLNGCIMRVDLANHFQKFGKIVSIVLPMNRPFYAFIQFSKAEEAKAALKHGLRQNIFRDEVDCLKSDIKWSAKEDDPHGAALNRRGCCIESIADFGIQSKTAAPPATDA